jgi:hypothetical protein
VEEIEHFTPLGDVLPLVSRQVISFPVQGNILPQGSPAVTAIVVQHPEDEIEDGHETAFQTEPPKHQYRCFLESFASGTPRVLQGAAEFDPCM